MEYPSKSSVELALRRLAEEIEDDTVQPFRVELLKIQGLREVVWVILGSDAAERRASAGFHGSGRAVDFGAFFGGKLSRS